MTKIDLDFSSHSELIRAILDDERINVTLIEITEDEDDGNYFTEVRLDDGYGDEMLLVISEKMFEEDDDWDRDTELKYDGDCKRTESIVKEIIDRHNYYMSDYEIPVYDNLLK